jgi:hypothetical protein
LADHTRLFSRSSPSKGVPWTKHVSSEVHFPSSQFFLSRLVAAAGGSGMIQAAASSSMRGSAVGSSAQ